MRTNFGVYLESSFEIPHKKVPIKKLEHVLILLYIFFLFYFEIPENLKNILKASLRSQMQKMVKHVINP